MKKYVIFLLVGIFSLLSVVAFAQTEESNPGMLPSSPFYFLKEWKRGVNRIFTFGSVKKAELELDEASERVAEIKKMEELGSRNEDALRKAAENYQENTERLKVRLEALKENSENPNVEKLIEKVIDKSVEHQELFDGLQEKLIDRDQAREQLQTSGEKMGEVISVIPQELKDLQPIREKLELRELNQVKELNQLMGLNQISSSSDAAASSSVKQEITEKEIPAILSPLKNINTYIQEKKEQIEERRREENCLQLITPAVSPDGVCKEFATSCDVPSDWKMTETKSCPRDSSDASTAASSTSIKALASSTNSVIPASE